MSNQIIRRFNHPGEIRIVRRILAILAIAFVAAAAIVSAAPPEPMAEVKGTVDKVISILQDPALKSNVAERRKELKDTVVAHFDFTAMARSALGYHWKDLSDQQRKDFVDLFTRFIEASYISQIESYGGQKIDYVKGFQDGPDYAQVNTQIIQDGKDPIGLNYRLQLESEDWKVYDVAVDNISIVANYRNQFNRVINNNGFDALMDNMRAKQASLDSSIAH